MGDSAFFVGIKALDHPVLVAWAFCSRTKQPFLAGIVS